LFAATGASAQDLLPEVRARLFAPSQKVQVASPIVRVPMRGTDHSGNAKCPYFQVYVNGRGPFTFLYDTGASYAVVGTRVLEAARLPVLVDRSRRDVVKLDRLKLGGVTVLDVLAIHDDDFGVDGIIGFPTLGSANVLFDHARRELLVSHKRIPMRRSVALRYQSPFNVPTVQVTIGKRAVPILIDTGDDAYGLEIRSSELGAAALVRPPVPAGMVMNGAVKQPISIATLVDPVVLGPWRAARAEIAINDSLPVGDFGFDMLKQFRFQIDPKQKVIEFEPLFRGNRFILSVEPESRKLR